MRRTWIALECNDCGSMFPMSRAGIVEAMDGAIYTWSMLRTEARSLGWQRRGDKDYCPVCEISHRAEAQKGGK